MTVKGLTYIQNGWIPSAAKVGCQQTLWSSSGTFRFCRAQVTHCRIWQTLEMGAPAFNYFCRDHALEHGLGVGSGTP